MDEDEEIHLNWIDAEKLTKWNRDILRLIWWNEKRRGENTDSTIDTEKMDGDL